MPAATRAASACPRRREARTPALRGTRRDLRRCRRPRHARRHHDALHGLPCAPEMPREDARNIGRIRHVAPHSSAALTYWTIRTTAGIPAHGAGAAPGSSERGAPRVRTADIGEGPALVTALGAGALKRARCTRSSDKVIRRYRLSASAGALPHGPTPRRTSRARDPRETSRRSAMETMDLRCLPRSRREV